MNRLSSLIFALGLGVTWASAHAATFTVTNTNDSGAGSLRDAIAQANVSPSPNTVNFASGVTGSIVLTTGQLNIAGPMSIVGPGSSNLTIDANANSRVFSIGTTFPACPTLDNDGLDYLVSISGLKLTNGRRGTSNVAGAIYTEHSLALDSVNIENSMAASGGGVGFMIQYPGQTLTINNAQFLYNTAKPISSIPNSHFGGAVYISEKCASVPTTTPVTVSMTNSLFSGNRVQPVGANGLGGAFGSFSRADVWITDTRIVDNGVDAPNPSVAGKRYRGGAIYGTLKSLTVLRSEISGNTATDATLSNLTRAGAIGLYYDDPTFQTPDTALAFKVTDSTISGNSASDTAGAIWLYGNIAFELSNSTVSNNSAANTRTGGLLLETGSTSPASSNNAVAPTFTAVSSIVADSSAGTADVASTTVSIPSLTINASNSLLENVCASCNITVTGTGNLTAVDPVLGALAMNGGTTRTQALLAGSPAIGTGSNPLNLATDQRGSGFARVVNGTADMGAYETSSRLLNIATRGKVETVDNVMIAGFIIQGIAPKKVLIRARGPSLAVAPFNVPGTLSDPFLTLYSGATPIDSNDDFAQHANAAQIPADWIPASAKEAAIVTTLNPGAYTAIVNGVGATSGVAIVEVFEIDQPGTPLINIATRGPVYTGDNVMIAGLIIQGDAPKTVLITARGPSMAGPPHNVPGTLPDPVLTLYSGQTPIASNDNWVSASNASQIQTAIGAPSNTLESAILVTLQPGAYTAIVSGAGGGTGLAIVEVFAQ